MISFDKQEAYEKMKTVTTKTELANELGIKIPEDGYWGNTSSRVCGYVGGAIGGAMVKEMVKSYEERLINNP